mmetsp:Transcript_47715/g.91174  ORF Transcript_47715/g.91174 Transcript_47715/m.91174 type:complete len:229 (-) Transcript_47715:313-999(-)
MLPGGLVAEQCGERDPYELGHLGVGHGLIRGLVADLCLVLPESVLVPLRQSQVLRQGLLEEHRVLGHGVPAHGGGLGVAVVLQVKQAQGLLVRLPGGGVQSVPLARNALAPQDSERVLSNSSGLHPSAPFVIVRRRHGHEQVHLLAAAVLVLQVPHVVDDDPGGAVVFVLCPLKPLFDVKVLAAVGVALYLPRLLGCPERGLRAGAARFAVLRIKWFHQLRSLPGRTT